jgi:flagellar L-ring protein precursor FlgH
MSPAHHVRLSATFLTLGLLAWATGLDPAAPARAQSNTLFGRRPAAPPPPATSQPSGAPTPQAAPGLPAYPTENDLRKTTADRPLKPKTNEVLLRTSPFAVDVPETEKIKVHDQVTIIVRESKTATTDSKLESKKDWKLDSALEKFIRFSDKNGIVPAKFEQGTPAALFNYKNDYKGDGKYDRKDELTTRIQATVVDVKPNGTLVVEATKAIDIDEEGYRISLTGICRGQDVTPQNTVLSTQIADMVIDVKHNGAVRDATRRGWFQRALDFTRLF